MEKKFAPEYDVISEDMIIQLDEELGGKNNFGKILDAGQKIRIMGLTPIYMLNRNKKTLEVVSVEEISSKN